MKKRKCSTVLVVMLVVVSLVLGGCGKSNSTQNDATNDSDSTSVLTPTTAATSDEPAESSGLPITDEKITLTFWMSNPPYEGMSWNDHPFFKEMEKRTNIHVVVEGPAPGQDINEAYQQMLASGNLPDVIQHNGNTYADGPDKAIADGVYLRLNEYIDKDMPNFKALLDSNPAAKKIITSTEGNIVHFPNSRPVDVVRQPPYVGPIIRADWLDKVGLKEPVTIEDWYNMLKAFKEQLGIDRPLTLPKEGTFWSRAFLSAYDVDSEFYVRDGKVRFGPWEDNMLAYITEMKKWYSEGLLALEDQNEELFYNDTRAAWCHGFYMLEAWKAKAKDPNYRAIGVKYPVLKEGNTINLFYGDSPASDFGFGFVITTANKYPEETCKYFDYWYSDEGTTLALYGTEGETYQLVDGKPQFTDYMVKNSDGKKFVQMLKENTINYLLNDWHIELAGFSKDESDAIAVKWAECKDTWSLQGYTQQLTTEESQKVTELWDGNIKPYVNSMIPKFITGEESLNNWGAFKEQLENLGVNEVIQIRQAALDRFNNK